MTQAQVHMVGAAGFGAGAIWAWTKGRRGWALALAASAAWNVYRATTLNQASRQPQAVSPGARYQWHGADLWYPVTIK